MDYKSIAQGKYEELESLRQDQQNYIKLVQNLDKKITVTKLEYRIESVKAVLEFINNKCWSKEEIELSKLQTMMTHCLNKLNGNIDGIECDWEEVK